MPTAVPASPPKPSTAAIKAKIRNISDQCNISSLPVQMCTRLHKQQCAGRCADVQLNTKVRLDLAVHFGAGQARLDLGSLQLRGVELEMGVGQLDLDLRGAPRHSYSVAIHGGIGEATVRLSADAGIYAEAHGGI